MIQAGARLKAIFGGFEIRLKFIKFGLWTLFLSSHFPMLYAYLQIRDVKYLRKPKMLKDQFEPEYGALELRSQITL